MIVGLKSAGKTRGLEATKIEQKRHGHIVIDMDLKVKPHKVTFDKVLRFFRK